MNGWSAIRAARSAAWASSPFTSLTPPAFALDWRSLPVPIRNARLRFASVPGSRSNGSRPTFQEILAHYVLFSWIYDSFHEVPYLRFQGDFGTGKTRALLVAGSLCYKPFFASGASTVSPLFHILDAFRGTLILDEADILQALVKACDIIRE